jgi:Ca2+-binding RTX toxin-like protein
MKAKLVPIILGALTVVLLGTTPASAAVTCTFAAGAVTVTMSSNGDLLFIQRQMGGDNIELTASGPTTVTCAGGTPTVNNTNTINVNDTSGVGSTFVQIALANGPFAPGLTPEPSSSEIEFNLSFGAGPSDQILLFGTYNVADRWTLGTDGINLNAGESAGVDSDVTYSGLESSNEFSVSGNDVVDGGGGDGTGAPFGIKMEVQGGDGADRITGSTVDDSIDADDASPFADVVNGGAGRDQLSTRFASSGVLVDLTRGIGGRGAGADDLTRIEDVFGSTFNDLLIGNARANTLSGIEGNDRLRPVGASPGGAIDAVGGGDDLDTVDYSNESRRVTVDLTSSASGCPQTASGPSIAVDCLSTIERAIGGTRGDLLVGDAVANILTGGGGEDEVRGGDGADVLRGKAENDQVFGEAGADRLDGGKHRDRCVGGPDPDTFTRCERQIQ